MNVSGPTLPVHRGSSDRAPRWRAATSLALSLALHALLLVLILRPAPPAVSPGRLDVVTVYLRDSRSASPPPAPEARNVTAPSQRAVAPSDVAQTPLPLGRKPTASARAPASTARDDANPARLARSASRVPVPIPPAAELPRAKPSPIDQQGNQARDSSTLYLRELAARLAQVKNYPRLALALREEGTVMLSFQIDRDGRLLAWSIASSSGHEELDREVGRMIAEAAPFPPFPPSWGQSEKAFQVPIGFYLH